MANDDSETDEALMALVQTGDHQAFSALVMRHTQRFFGAAYRMTGHVQQSEDIVQDAFIKLWQNPQRWNPNKGAKFTTWFYRIVTNLSIDHLRKNQPVSSSDTLERFESDEPSAEKAMVQKQEEALLEDAIEALPERQRAALNLCVYEDMNQKEAAEILGVKLKALESLLSRAKAGIKDYIARQSREHEQETEGHRYG